MTTAQHPIVFITGASSGIGAACAKKFAQAGARLILAARRSQRLQQLATELESRYQTTVLSLELDVSDYKQVKNSIESLPADWKKIAVLINCAGLAAGRNPVQTADIDDWEAMINTNLKGLVYVTRCITPLMIANNHGHIINIGSTAGHQAYPGGNVYSATKAAVRSFSAGLKLDLHGTPIRVTEIDPGLVETEFSIVRFKGDTSAAKQVYQGMTPLTPDDVADTIHFAATRPPHVNIMEILMYATDQSGVQTVFRREEN